MEEGTGIEAQMVSLGLGAGGEENKLQELYQRLAECIKMENSDEENLAMMRNLPVVQAYLFGCFPSLGEHEVFSILLRFNKGDLGLTEEEERLSQMKAPLEDQVLSLVVCMVLQSTFGRLPLVALQERVGFLCGECNKEKVGQSFFENVAQGVCLLIKKKGSKRTKKKQQACHDYYKATPAQFADAEDDDEDEEEDDEGNEDEEADVKEDEGVDASWVVLRGAVKYELEDADDKEKLVKILADMVGKQPLKLKTIRQRFQRDVGIPFGTCDVGGLLKFLKGYPSVFDIHETSRKRHKDSTIALHGSTASQQLANQKKEQRPATSNNNGNKKGSPQKGGAPQGKGRGGRGKRKGGK